MVFLSLMNLIDELNDRFGTEFTGDDQTFFKEMKDRHASNDIWQQSAKSTKPNAFGFYLGSLFDEELHSRLERKFELFRCINA